jgi:hypothetical protein
VQETFKDRSSGLVVFGVLEILLGAFCGLAFALTLVMMFAMAGLEGAEMAGLSLRTSLPGLSLYGFLAGFFCWLGVGTMRARRWARELGLVVAWLWLITGLSSLLLAAFMWAPLQQSMVELLGLPDPWVGWILALGLLLTTVLHVVLPGVMVLFLRSPDVVATCRARGPQQQWSDGVPAHVLSLGLIYLIILYSILLIPVYGFAVPFFGVLVGGVTGWVLVVLMVLLCAWLTVATLRRRRLAWWVGVGSCVAAGISTTLTFWRVSVAEYLASAPLSEVELGVLQAYGSFGRGSAVLLSLLCWATLLAYQVYVLRYFVADQDGGLAP